MAPPLRLIVVGASAGGVEALSQLAADLPADLPAAVLVVLHTPRSGSSRLATILDRAGPLPAHAARDGERLEPSRIVVAPPDVHMTVDATTVRIAPGPRVNGHQPSVDLLFESAARAFGSRCAGVILSGALSDGTLGLLAIKQHGGVALVQADALHEGMPASALAKVDVDYVVPLRRLGETLTMAVQALEEVAVTGDTASGSEASPRGTAPHASPLEQGFDLARTGPPPGTPTPYRCPECGGALWEQEDDRVSSFACHVGHRYSTASLVEGQADAVERALWAAVRSLEEKAALSARLAGSMSTESQRRSKDYFRRRATEAARQADLVREVLTVGRGDVALELEGEA